MAHYHTSKSIGMDGKQVANPMVRCVTKLFTAAEVIASNATPLVLVEAPGPRQVVLFFDGFLQVVGGSANYDQNQNFTVNYQVTGAGATCSTTLANFLNGAAADVLGTIKQLTTDIVPEVNQPLVLLSSASPFAAAGDRKLAATVWYTIVDFEEEV